MKRNVFHSEDVEVLDQVTVYDGYFKIETYSLKHKLYAGGWSPALQRELFERGHAVAVLPYDPIEDRVVLIEQFRVGAYVAKKSEWVSDITGPWMIEGVAGIIEPGERPEDVARREAVEEIGREVEDLRLISKYLVSPGGTSESVTLYIGKVDSRNVSGTFGLEHEGEDILPFSLSLDQAIGLLERGEIANATTIIALQWLQIHKEKVRLDWR